MPHIHEKKLKQLEELAVKVREDIITMLLEAKSGHSAGPLGMADVFVALYFHVLHHDPKNPDWPDRDRLILSNGHICPVRYAVMAHAGYFPREELKTLRKFGSRLQGHPERERLPGAETTSGPLGSGLGQAAGMAYAARMLARRSLVQPSQPKLLRRSGREGGWRTYCVMSDAEQACGVTYEAMLFAGANKLSNLTAIIDRNNIQIDGFTEDIMPIEPLRAKYEACNWHVLEVDGHNIKAIVDAMEEAKTIAEKPTLIIAHTIPGRGVSFMEHKFEWHGIPPNAAQAAVAMKELRTLEGRIQSEHE